MLFNNYLLLFLKEWKSLNVNLIFIQWVAIAYYSYLSSSFLMDYKAQSYI